MAVLDLRGVNSYPKIKRIQISTTAQQITLPDECTAVSIGCQDSALYFANEGGADGDTFSVDITDYAFIPANNLLPIAMERGRQANRTLLVATQNGTGDLIIVIEKQ